MHKKSMIQLHIHTYIFPFEKPFSIKIANANIQTLKTKLYITISEVM